MGRSSTRRRLRPVCRGTRSWSPTGAARLLVACALLAVGVTSMAPNATDGVAGGLEFTHGSALRVGASSAESRSQKPLGSDGLLEAALYSSSGASGKLADRLVSHVVDGGLDAVAALSFARPSQPLSSGGLPAPGFGAAHLSRDADAQRLAGRFARVGRPDAETPSPRVFLPYI